MIGRVVRWFNRVLPWPGLPGVIAFLALVAVVQWLLYGALYLVYGTLPDEWNALLIHRPLVGIMLMLWGFWRSTSINPVFMAGYRDWLATTPWTPYRPLPLASVELGWQDPVLLGGASALIGMWPQAWLAPLAFLLPYSFMLGLANYRAEQDEAVFAAVALSAVLPLSLLFVEEHPWAPLLLTACITGVTLWGWRRTLRLFPWEDLPRFMAAEERGNERVKRPRYDKLWPRVHPLDSLELGPRLGWRTIGMIAVGTAWVSAAGAYTVNMAIYRSLVESGVALESLSAEDLRQISIGEEAMAGVSIAAWVVALVRLGIYMASCAAPISLRGRWATGRLIIPGYDRIFVAPLAVLTIGWSGPWGLRLIGLPVPAIVFVSMLAIMLAAFGLGPSLASWQLTGEHRLRMNRPMPKSGAGRRSMAAGGSG